MLHRKIYQLFQDGHEVCIFLRDQQRWIDNGRIVDFEGDLVTIRYETEEEDEVPKIVLKQNKFSQNILNQRIKNLATYP